MKTNKQIVFDFLDHCFTSNCFHGRQLKESIFSCTGRDPYTETVLKYTREYCSITGAKLICLNKQKSKNLNAMTLNLFLILRMKKTVS